jgi:hypothetical protein
MVNTKQRTAVTAAFRWSATDTIQL